MLKVILTGGIGVGKTTVANLFAKLGAPILDADKISHQLTQTNYPATQKIIQRFGENYADANGKLNRQALRELAFNDNAAKQWLEDLLHPLIIDEIKTAIENIDNDYCVIVIPLVTQKNQFEFADRVLVVHAHSEQQIDRVKTRDNNSEHTIQKIIDSQINTADRLAIADDIIENTGDLKKLSTQIKKLHKKYCELNNKK